LGAATLTTGLISGFFYAYACSVTLGLALLSDEQYLEAMPAINATVRNGVFAFSFFGAVLSLLLAFAIHAPRLRSRRFVLVALAAVLYIGGGFMLSPALLASLAELVGLRATLEVVISIAGLTVVLSLGLDGEKKPT
jgi:uncharacterized membrane protein